MGLVINEEKTKFQCRAVESTELSINNKNIERVRHYKYLRMYVGYTADNKEAELNNLLTQCKARLQPIKVLAWSRTGVGVSVLRSMYISTVRSLIDYARSVLSFFGSGRMEKLEKLQNAAMRII